MYGNADTFHRTTFSKPFIPPRAENLTSPTPQYAEIIKDVARRSYWFY
jgi:hypothetical protein